jgi:hypothetical protein
MRSVGIVQFPGIFQRDHCTAHDPWHVSQITETLTIGLKFWKSYRQNAERLFARFQGEAAIAVRHL